MCDVCRANEEEHNNMTVDEKIAAVKQGIRITRIKFNIQRLILVFAPLYMMYELAFGNDRPWYGWILLGAGGALLAKWAWYQMSWSVAQYDALATKKLELENGMY